VPQTKVIKIMCIPLLSHKASVAAFFFYLAAESRVLAKMLEMVVDRGEWLVIAKL
jgi:hypothetical protein